MKGDKGIKGVVIRSAFLIATWLWAMEGGAAPLVSGVVNPPKHTPPPRLEMDLSGTWEVLAQPSYTGELPEKGSAWSTTYVPMLLRRDKSKDCYWYRRVIEVPSEWEGRCVELVMEGACAYSIVHLDGKKLAEGFTHNFPLVVDLTDHLRPGQRHELLIALRNSHGEYSEVNSLYFQRDAEGRLICLYPGTGLWDIPGSVGIWQPIYLRALHPVNMEYQFIQTSFRQKRIDVDVHIRNQSKAPVTVEVSGTIPRGVDLAAKQVAIEAGKTVTLRLSQRWENPLLWQPGQPNLYWLTTTLKQDGRVVDEISDRFGFREFWVEGTDYYINGHRLYLNLATFGMYTPAYWNRTPEQVVEEMRGHARHLRSLNYNLLRWWFQVPRYMREMADEEGMLVNDMIFGDQGEGVSVNAEWIYWKNAIALFDRFFPFNCNHPSVFYWTIQNEGWISPKPGEWGQWLLEGMNTCARHIMAKDPTRFVNSDGDGDMRGFLLGRLLAGDDPEARAKAELPPGLLPQFSWHFAVGTLDAALHPENYYWLEQGKEPYWDRTKPLVLGEMGGNTMSIYDLAGYLGEGAWTMPNAFGHADGEYSYGVVKAARAQGLSGTKVWLIGDPTFQEYIKRAQAPQIVIPRQFDFHFYAGQTVPRKLKVINGLLEDRSQPINWSLSLPARNDGSGFFIGGGLQDSGEVMLHLPGGRATDLTIALRMPKAEALPGGVVRAEATWTMRYGTFEDPMPVRIVRPFEKLVLPGVTVALYDPEGTSSEALNRLVEGIRLLEDLTQLEKVDVLILGDESVSPAMPPEAVTAVREFAERGGRVILLQQTEEIPKGLLPVTLKQDEMKYKHGRNFIVAAHHPVLAGLDDLDFRFWAPDYTVSRYSFVKPTAGSFRILVQSFHPRGLTTCTLVEMKAGAGLFLASQLELASKAGKSPMADLLLQRLVKYAAEYRAPAPSKAVLVGNSESPAVQLLLRRYGMIMEQAAALTPALLAEASFIFVDGSDGQALTRVQSVGEGLADYLAAGKTLLWHRAQPQDEAFLSQLSGRRVTVTPMAEGQIVTAFRLRSDPVLDGISHMDVFYTLFGGWPAWPKQLNGVTHMVAVEGVVPAVPPEGFRPAPEAPVELVSSGALVRVSVGKGALYINQLLWDSYALEEKDQDVQDRQDRYISQLLANLGVLSTASGTVSDLFDVPDAKAVFIDLRPFVNMGFKDDEQGNGKGGWSDQGINDMRYFPTGRQRFQGVPFDVIVPEQNDGKAVITWTYLSAEQRQKVEGGFPVGRKLKRLFILHSSAWTPAAADLAEYTVTYEDGTQERFKAASPLHLHDWWRPYSVKDPGAGIAWVGRLAYPGAPQVAMFMMSWVNPHPEKEIKTVTLKALHGFYILAGMTGELPE